MTHGNSKVKRQIRANNKHSLAIADYNCSSGCYLGVRQYQ